MNADKASIAAVRERLFGHRRYGSAIYGADTNRNNSADEFRAAPYYGKPL